MYKKTYPCRKMIGETNRIIRPAKTCVYISNIRDDSTLNTSGAQTFHPTDISGDQKAKIIM